MNIDSDYSKARRDRTKKYLLNLVLSIVVPVGYFYLVFPIFATTFGGIETHTSRDIYNLAEMTVIVSFLVMFFSAIFAVLNHLQLVFLVKSDFSFEFRKSLLVLPALFTGVTIFALMTLAVIAALSDNPGRISLSDFSLQNHIESLLHIIAFVCVPALLTGVTSAMLWRNYKPVRYYA